MNKILLIDDERATLDMLGLLLEAYDYAVLTAESAAAGLDIFRKEQPPIVLTDIKMPGMDGIQVLQTIKDESPDTEVIMITGHGDIELAIQSLKYEATDFVTKPINSDVLMIAMKRANERISFKKKIKEYTENLEQLVEEKTRKLVEAERMAAVGQTVAGLAHALKNVTGALKGGTFVLEKGIELENKKYLNDGWNMLKGNIGRVTEIALDLLNYTKEREPKYERCDPNRPVREVFDLMVPRAREHGVTVEMDLDKSLPEIWFDPEGIHRCLLNLVTNAVDACADVSCSTKKEEVVLRSLKPEGWAVEYQVVDSGCGMDQETRAKIFHSFFSTKGSRGTGLGLMITKKIVDEHGGIIEMESDTGKGTRFIIRLPEKDQRTEP
jgi:signal transduction histidine kinase